jgi:hypothetical protein
MERWGQMIDRASAGITDAAELFAVGLRISGRLGWTHPDIAGFLTGAGLDALDIPRGLAPRALRDIQAGQAAGRFTVPDAEIALSAVAGGLLGLLRMCQRHPERITEASVGQLAEALLRLLGVPASEAARLAALPLPPLTPGDWRDGTGQAATVALWLAAADGIPFVCVPAGTQPLRARRGCGPARCDRRSRRIHRRG